jgi:hypothetical protein
MKTFAQFQEQMLSAVDRKEIKMAGLKSAARQNVRNAAWQRRHVYHEIETKNRREDQERQKHERETQPA